MRKTDKYKKQFQIVIQNNHFVESRVFISKKWKMVLYDIACILFNTCQKDNRHAKIHIINGKSELRLKQYKDYEDIYYGFTQTNLKELRSQKTMFSYFTRVERIRILLAAAVSYFTGSSCKGPFVYWIDFYFWNAFLNRSQAKILLSNGHYDRLTTCLSVLCREKHILFYMKQHGFTLTDRTIPNKLHCNRLYAFDEEQAGYFKKNVIANKDCEYVLEYENNVTFSYWKKKAPVIGIIENPTCGMKDIIQCVINHYKDDTAILIMLHPLSRKRTYKAFEGIKNVYISRKKIRNADLLVCAPSALVYDYIRNGFANKIIFVDQYRKFPEYRSAYNNLIYVEGLCELDETLQDKDWKNQRDR